MNDKLTSLVLLSSYLNNQFQQTNESCETGYEWLWQVVNNWSVHD
jgi:hypothetical protein